MHQKSEQVSFFDASQLVNENRSSTFQDMISLFYTY